MNCVICRNPELVEGQVTVTLERGGATLVFKNVPALVCPNCGEQYVAEEISARLLERADTLATEGAQVDVREFAV